MLEETRMSNAYLAGYYSQQYAGIKLSSFFIWVLDLSLSPWYLVTKPKRYTKK